MKRQTSLVGAPPSAEYQISSDSEQRRLRAATEEDPGDGVVIRAALKHLAQTQNISALDRNTGLNRGNTCGALSEYGNPTLATLLKVTNASGPRLRLEPVEDRALGAQPTGAGVFQQESARQPNRISRR